MSQRGTTLCLIIVTMLAFGACTTEPEPRGATDAQPERTRTDTAAPSTGASEEPRSQTVPTATIVEEAPTQPAPAAARGRNLELIAPAASVSANPFEVRGRARTFENHVTIRVLDAQRRKIAETYATATGDLGQMNPFTASVMLTRSPGREVTIELLDFSAKDGSVRERVTRTVPYEAPDVPMQLYFSAAGGGDCTKVVAVSRRLPNTPSRIRATVEALLDGPTAEEKRSGLTAPFPRGVSIRGVNVKDGVAIVDFNEAMRNVGGSCRAQALRAMIVKSLLAIEGVRAVEIRADGSKDLALQP